MTARVGEVLLGKYRIERELGRGGMGYVVAARHLELGELVAIKMILGEYARNDEMVRRFMREARTAAQIASDHVVRVMDVGRLPSGEPFMVMELLKGEDLEAVLEARGALPVAEAVDLLLQVLEAVAEAHAAGIVHRDLKPANLYLTRRRSGDPCIKVLDFGISKLTGEAATGGLAMTQGPLGSPLYMSPEQLRSSVDIDGRADIWSLGVILFQMLTLDHPFTADSLPQLIVKVLDLEPASIQAIRPDVPLELVDVVMHCLAKDRARRIQSVTELAHALAPFGSVAARTSLAAIENALPSSREPTSESALKVGASSAADLPVARAATLVMWPQQASTLEPLDASTSSSPGPQGDKSPSKTSAFRIVAALGLAAVVVVTLAGLTKKAPPTAIAAPSAGMVALVVAPSVSLDVPPAAPMVPAPSALPAMKESPPLPSAPPKSASSAPSKPKPSPSLPLATGGVAPAPVATVNCSPPYNVGTNGMHTAKPECL